MNAHDFLNFSCFSNHFLLRTLSCRSFRNFLRSFSPSRRRTVDFYEAVIARDAKHETMMALLFWLARFYIFGFFAARKSPTIYSSSPKNLPKKKEKNNYPKPPQPPLLVCPRHFFQVHAATDFSEADNRFLSSAIKEKHKETNFLTVFLQGLIATLSLCSLPLVFFTPQPHS